MVSLLSAINVEECLFMARVAEQAQRFNDMVNYLEQVLLVRGADLTIGERNLISIAFKGLMSAKRAACRTIGVIEQNPKYTKFGDQLTYYKNRLEFYLV